MLEVWKISLNISINSNLKSKYLFYYIPPLPIIDISIEKKKSANFLQIRNITSLIYYHISPRYHLINVIKLLDIFIEILEL